MARAASRRELHHLGHLGGEMRQRRRLRSQLRLQRRHLLIRLIRLNRRLRLQRRRLLSRLRRLRSQLRLQLRRLLIRLRRLRRQLGRTRTLRVVGKSAPCNDTWDN
jgi:hypothetical protein